MLKKEIIGCCVNERLQAELLLNTIISGFIRIGWVDLCNRKEEIKKHDTGAVECLWKGSSFLTVAKIFPKTGGRILKHCLKEWPVTISNEEKFTNNKPEISVILPVAGKERLPLFQFVLRSYFGQTLKNYEIIVVEHSREPLFEKYCPPYVKYIYIKLEEDQAFSRSLTFNMGVRHASTSYVVLQDSDIVPPARFLESLLKLMKTDGWEAIRPMRFVFLLDPHATEKYMKSDGRNVPDHVDRIRQNCTGGGVAIKKTVYEEIGGHDESFWGWGHEDIEFYERLNSRLVFPGSYLPMIHLWHEPAPKKKESEKGNQHLLELRLSVPLQERINELKAFYEQGGTPVFVEVHNTVRKTG